MFGYSKNAVDNKLKAQEARIVKLEQEVKDLMGCIESHGQVHNAQVEFARMVTVALGKLDNLNK